MDPVIHNGVELAEMDWETFNNHIGPIRFQLSLNGSIKYMRNLVFPYPVHISEWVGRDGEVNPLIFQNCVFQKDVIIGNQHSVGKVQFGQCAFEDNLYSEQDNLDGINTCSFKKNLTLEIKEANKPLSGLIVPGTLQVSAASGSLVLRNINEEAKKSQTKLIVYATDCEVNIQDCVASEILCELNNNPLTFFANVVAEEVKMNFSNSTKPTNLLSCQFKEIEIQATDKNLLDIEISECKFGEFYLDATMYSDFFITNSIVSQLTIGKRSAADANINISTVKIDKFLFDNFFNSGNLIIRDLNSDPGQYLSILSSDLGKTDFINCDFSAGFFEFENSKITNVFLSETKFPGQVHLYKKLDFAQAQLAFGQIVAAYQKQGDTINALEYNSRELEAHYRQLSRSKNKDYFTEANLWLNWQSNDFGRSWGRGVLFTLQVGLLFFLLLIFTTGNYGFIGKFDYNLIISFFKFLNPLRFFELPDVFKGTTTEGRINLHPGSYFFDFLGRIFIAYGFYQTIQAFRRFGRK